MLIERAMRWASRWLERHGLGVVADTLDSRVATTGNVDATHAIARRALDRSEVSEAFSLLKKSVAIDPGGAKLWCTMGAAHRQMEGFAAARVCYTRALTLRSDYPEVLSNLGELSIATSQFNDALGWFDQALACAPNFFEARLNQVAALFEMARYEEAREAAEKLVADEADRPEPYLNLGNVLVHIGQAKQGIQQYQKALELRPGYPEAHFNLGSLLGSRKDLIGAIDYLKRQIKERGETVQRMGLLATALQAAGYLGEAEELCQRIFERQPDNICALTAMASCLSNGGDTAAAMAFYERVIELNGMQAIVESNLLFESNNLSMTDREAVFHRHCAWAAKHEAPLLESIQYTEYSNDPERKLRIGYVSGDFVSHPVGFLLRDILRHHDENLFDIHLFSMVIRSEEVLPELREAADVWQDIFFLNDKEVVELIRKSEIDILVDLSGHTAFNRLLVFARRPAPVQVEWLGYFHSTGMCSIDYFITDPHTTPPDGGQLFSETPVFMPHTRFCYGPPEYAPDIQPPSVEKTNIITFGSFNRLSKINEEVIGAWARILHKVPNSRLVMKSHALSEEIVRERLTTRFAQQGILRDRLDLRSASPHSIMLAEYGDIDIALDTFPFNGGMTTIEALWMGVPVVTLAGNSVVSRQSISALANLGLDSRLAFPDVEAYVRGAVDLANNRSQLAEFRLELRPRMAASPLRQSEQFARDLEALYRRMWITWCHGKKLGSELP
jgi:protein O-GlcNAc transferase